MNHILIDLPIHEGHLRRLQALPEIRVEVIAPSEDARVLPAELLHDKRILLCTTPPSNLEDMQALELIQIASAGHEQLNGLGLPAREVRACNASGVFDTAIAEWNVAMMINLARDLRGMVRNQEHGIWDRGARYQRELRGSVVGLWGYGGIGRETARLARTIGLQVHVFSRRTVGPRLDAFSLPATGDPEGKLPDRVFLPGQEHEFLAGLDFLILALPLTGQSRGLLGERELRALKSTAYLLNPARGPIIQEDALLRALREGWIAGAALDTHHHYPMPADHPLWRFPNVILTPHISGSSAGPFFLERIWDLFVQNVERYLSGHPLLNRLTPERLNDDR